MLFMPRILGISLAIGVLSGCTAYSGAINSLGPERPVSDLYLPGEYSIQRAPFCPAPEIVMVMPEDDQGVVTVRLPNGEAYVLEGDYAALSITEERRETFTGDQEQLMGLFGDAINALPAAPTYDTVYFETGSAQLTASSQAAVNRIIDELLSRPVPQILVIGHTDTTASDAFNQQLSEARAALVRDQLVEAGVDPTTLRIEGRGERDLLVETADNVPEARNRRVEINVR